MEIPEKVAQIQSYTQLKSKRAELEKQIKPLRKRLSDMETELSKMEQDMDLSCWEQVGDELWLWSGNGSGVVIFTLRGG